MAQAPVGICDAALHFAAQAERDERQVVGRAEVVDVDLDEVDVERGLQEHRMLPRDAAAQIAHGGVRGETAQEQVSAAVPERDDVVEEAGLLQLGQQKEGIALLKGALKLEVAKDAFHLETVWELFTKLKDLHMEEAKERKQQEKQLRDREVAKEAATAIDSGRLAK